MLKKFFKVSDDDNYEEIYEDEEYEEVLDKLLLIYLILEMNLLF